MDRDTLLRVVVSVGCLLVALCAVIGGIALEMNGRETPAWLGALAGAAVGQIASVVKRPEERAG